jgi:hypothetical protein
MDRAALILIAVAALCLPHGFAGALADKAAQAEANQKNFVEGSDGWRFLPGELRFADKLASPEISVLTETAVRTIADFSAQLKVAGLALLVVPVPPKVLAQSQALGIAAEERDKMKQGWEKIMADLGAKNVQVVDLLSDYSAAAEASFCLRDTHWSGPGIEKAVQRLAPLMQSAGVAGASQGDPPPWKETAINGDLGGELEKIKLRFPPLTGLADTNSSLLLLGDSHVLVFHQGGDLHASGAGLPEQVASVAGAIPEVIGVRGSGATSSRLQLARKLRAEPDYLAGKKLVLWVFAGREFTEADAWKKIPIFPAAKKGEPGG